MVFCCPQVTTVRQWLPLVNFVLYWRNAAMDALDHFEKLQKHSLGLHTFSKLGAVYDPRFLDELMAVMLQDKASLGRVTTSIASAARTQWYTWHIYCPDLPIHQERRMSQ